MAINQYVSQRLNGCLCMEYMEPLSSECADFDKHDSPRQNTSKPLQLYCNLNTW